MSNEYIKLESEMKRGFLQVLVLVLLDKPMYGYMMLKHLESIGYAIEESTLYPLLRRLEKNELIRSKWDVGADRPRKFYTVSQKGKDVKERLLVIWEQQDTILKSQQKEEKNV